MWPSNVGMPGPRPFVDRLDGSETALDGIGHTAIAPEREHTLAGNDLEPVLVAATDIAAIDAAAK